MVPFIYNYININKSYLEAFIFTSFLYAFWDACLFFMFDKATKYVSLLLYDVFFVGGFCMIATQFLTYNYYDFFKNYIPILFMSYILTMSWFFYGSYKYNQNLKNTKGFSFA